jgi:hypothetical protein
MDEHAGRPFSCKVITDSSAATTGEISSDGETSRQDRQRVASPVVGIGASARGLSRMGLARH